MTRKDVIDQVNALVSNTVDAKQKEMWLEEADALIRKRIAENYEGYEVKELCVEPPFDMLYVHWLEAKIAYYCGEYDRYANAYRLFNNTLTSFYEYHHRSHMPKSHGTWKF